MPRPSLTGMAECSRRFGARRLLTLLHRQMSRSTMSDVSAASDARVPYRDLFELSPDACLLFVDGAVTHANHAAARLFGAGAIPDLVGRRSTELLHPGCFSEVEQRVIALMAEPALSILAEERYVRLDGRPVDVETMVARAMCFGGKAFIVSLRDVSVARPRRRGTGTPMGASEGADPLVQAADVVGDWAVRYALTSAEAFILRNSVRGQSRSAIAERLRVAPATVKKHVHNLVQKTGDASLSAAVQRALREVMTRLSESTLRSD
jgi:PAS domain S-box-containing protein